jgi:hypothetical protein
VAAERMAAPQAPQSEPAAADDAMSDDRVAHVIGTRRLKSAGASK